MFSYGALGLVIIWSVFKVPVLANFLQKYMNRAIGPLLILTGIFLLDIIKLGFTTFSIPVDAQKRLAGGGVAGAFILGMLFALVFCPVSAALFFGSLITLAMGNKAGALLPLVYGLGTGIPVLIFAVLIAAGVSSLTRWFDRLRGIELYMRKATGAVFILVGSYYVSVYILK
jgi:cytochrome c biogenesis protein CcdA